MKKHIMIIAGLTCTLLLMSQEKTRQNEIGLIFNDLDNFGLTYRVGSESALWRFNTLFVSGGNSEELGDSLSTTKNSIGIGVDVGREYRKELVNNLELRLGADLIFRYNQSKSDRDDESVVNRDRFDEMYAYRYGVNLVIGFNYIIGENIVLGAELLPKFTYKSGKSTNKYYDHMKNEVITENDLTGFYYGLSNTSVLLSLAYRF